MKNVGMQTHYIKPKEMAKCIKKFTMLNSWRLLCPPLMNPHIQFNAQQTIPLSNHPLFPIKIFTLFLSH